MGRVLALALAALAAATPAFPEELQNPIGPVVLTVTGVISNTNAPGAAEFDLEMLDALEQRVSTVETPWYDGPITFEGPLGSAILDAVGARGDTIVITALNDYSSPVPADDFRTWPVILATRQDGKRMAVRDKGPLFVIYPFDLDPILQNEVYFGRSVWQVRSIDVR
jgi:hypothetical protein